MRWPSQLSLLIPQLSMSSFAPPKVYTPSTKSFALKEGNDILTPKDMLELPRPGSAVANPAGDLAFISVSEYSFEIKKMNSTIYIASLDDTDMPATFPVLNGGDAFWLTDRTLAHVISESGGQAIYAISFNYSTEPKSLTPDSPVFIGHLPPSPASNFKYKSGILAFSANVWEDGDLFTTPELDKQRSKEGTGTSARVYEGGYPRHWDTWTTPGKESQLFTVSLTSSGEIGEEKWSLGDAYVAPLKGTKHYTPVEPFGGSDDFDLSSTHLVYTAKDPELPYPIHTRQNVYIVPVTGGEPPRQLTAGKQGATHTPVFSNDGTKVAWTELRKDGYESDRARVMVYDLEKDVRFGITEKWDTSPSALIFSPNDASIYALSGDQARGKLYVIPLPVTPSSTGSIDAYPVPLVEEHTVSSVQPLLDGRVLFSQNSLTHPSEVFLREKNGKISQITQLTAKKLAGKSLSPGHEFWFKGAEGVNIQGWVNLPPGFRKGDKAKWPMAFLIHGGPQGAWEDSWSTRWNPNVFAQQGYVTVTVNPTGSTTFGQALTDAIAKDWGGKPFVDLQAGYKEVLRLYPEIHPEKTVAAGASWGGYAINWIAGHPEFDFNFKALVCHDGVFDTRANGFVTDELFFFDQEFGGPPWKSAETVEKFNPANFVEKWSIPMLIFHGERDYRLPVTEGIGAFHSNKRMGVPTRLVVFPEENHWVLDPGNSLKWHTEIFEWFAKWLD
ncbi:alpha/beta-hydrolase [Dacryopinax primogenitus]|uniref:Dipeptidyl-peptidase V n=1 Tax=Dacryopinax primogenitus (strain DJM 731) TaxID=1858805 RepID=M5FV66_DACPD|nr:alpha/beta-hydrolase [Dacryopinax primogenitus]EJU00159.1 alpha/beta-hydrolase [Dacryopinax primogenitus]